MDRLTFVRLLRIYATHNRSLFPLTLPDMNDTTTANAQYEHTNARFPNSPRVLPDHLCIYVYSTVFLFKPVTNIFELFLVHIINGECFLVLEPLTLETAHVSAGQLLAA